MHTQTYTLRNVWEQRNKEILGGDGHVRCGDSLRVCTYVKTHQIISFMYSLLYINHTSVKLFKKGGRYVWEENISDYV